MIKAVIFDWGGVVNIWHDHHTILYISRRFGLDYDETDKIFNKLIPFIQIKKIDIHEFWRMFFKNAKISMPKDYKDLLLKKFRERAKQNRDVALLVKKLKRMGYRVALLSNTELQIARYIRKRGWYKGFYPVILSHELGVRKPSKRIYNLTLKKLGLKANECIFIDDNAKNIIPAKKLGMKIILFKNTKQLIKELKRLGVHGI